MVSGRDRDGDVRSQQRLRQRELVEARGLNKEALDVMFHAVHVAFHDPLPHPVGIVGRLDLFHPSADLQRIAQLGQRQAEAAALFVQLREEACDVGSMIVGL